MDKKTPIWILPVIVVSQFCCTSLWFAGNGVMGELAANFGLDENALGHLTSAVQFGFITGTLLFAILTIADRFSPSKVFMFSALLGAIFNLGIIWQGNSFASLITLRFLTGFFLAGIYPVGMKIAADYFEKGLGRSLGFLVGALVLGTAFPHLLKDLTGTLPYRFVILSTSGIALLGGLLMLSAVPDGPYRKAGQRLDLTASLKVFRNPGLRSAAFGYFGHMWELYAFWTFIPVILKTYSNNNPESTFNIPAFSFLIIGIGGISCVIGGYLSLRTGPGKIAFAALLISCVCCLISPFLFGIRSTGLFIACPLIWGMAVVADSPLFSTMVADNASPQIKGTALTIVNCIGFSITIISIQIINGLQHVINQNNIYIILALGPVLGLTALANPISKNHEPGKAP